MGSDSGSDSDYHDAVDDGEQSLLLECLDQQVFELELLQSMFSPKELCFIDCLSPSVLRSIHSSALQGNMNKLDQLSPEFTVIKECVGDKDTVCTVEVTVQFSPLYPVRKSANAFARCDQLQTAQLSLLNKSMRDYILTIDIGTPCVIEIITWLDAHFGDFYASSNGHALTRKEKKCTVTDTTFGRWFIYSHHIYSKFKRKDILTYAMEKHLTGFCCPGKPGIICVEGSDQSCTQFWDILRTWTWKKIVIRHKDVRELKEGESMDSLRHFSDFREMGFEIRSGKHLDGGAFKSFLLENNLDADDIFRELFGINAKETE